VRQVAAIPAAERSAYLGSAACVTCHTKQAGQRDSHHAVTLRRVAEVDRSRFRRGGAQTDAATGTRTQVALRGDRCVLTARQRGRSEEVEAEYAFGSGNRGVTYLGPAKGRRIELRLSYYRPVDRWDVTPNQQGSPLPESPVGRIVAGKDEETCFACHSTALVSSGGKLRPEQSILGIGCEGCHGPGSAHVAAVRSGAADLKMANLGKAPAHVSEKLCGQCHSAPGSNDPTDPNVQAQLARFQSIALPLSACYVKSEGRLTCMTCHDPHQDATQRSRVEYNRICASCHRPAATPHRVTCTFQPTGDCVGCHMPSTVLPVATNPRYHQHWIGVWGKKPAP
jgi:hypothetical protein